ncbi:biliverdin-producing heme oxygenase [Gramella jeungdoensis]|uniref:Biliverdin-producing heme oxygenase n=1 Tax=Gramella jeungdoensis TaxID=708091 RepID=A0ABT0Z4J7_9FLAO|nr:biliverdin-producing heme oxygenase [Gramella jeungdoensis]MCM8570444.1 biliverdin-producing heme oxygenase [Gramella jeungdoensis]
MLNRLREATAELHKKLEGENLANKIVDHSINLDEYKLLLYQNYLAYSTVEDQLLEFIPGQSQDKSEKLKNDLSEMGMTNLDSESLFEFSCKNEAEAIGAAYVIEGSAMGGMIIGKEVKKCDSLKNLPEQTFFNGTRDSIKGWNEFLKFLRSREFTEKEKELAANKAKETFKLFEKAFNVEFSNC